MTLNIGDKAPEFEGKDQNGKTVKLSDYRGKKVILYFYPKDDTSGCTAQACNLRDNYSDLQKEGYEVIGVSIDPEKSHQKFIGKYDLPFTLIADTEKQIVEQYGVWQERASATILITTVLSVATVTILLYLIKSGLLAGDPFP